MDVSALSSMGALTAYADKQVMGAEIVSQTLDYMNGVGGQSSLVPTDKQSFGAAVVSKTLDYMNAGSGASSMGGMSQTYNFSKDVLGAYMSGRGALADYTV